MVINEQQKQAIIEEAKLLDAKKAAKKRVRKTPTKEEKAKAEIVAMLNYENAGKTIKTAAPKSADTDEWDVKAGDPIDYFDPSLSYELTGYRPITKDRGLDFDPAPFMVAAETYRRDGKYTALIPGTFKHRNHWVQEFNKCLHGVTIGKYRITGEHYFFLNYYRLLSVLGTKSGDEVRQEDFPGFLAKQYEYFHYLELARKSGHDVCVFKCRGINKPVLS